jgi:hypothetical protein
MSCVLARCLTAAIFVLFLAAPAFAQERDQVNRDRPAPLVPLYVSFAALQALDVHSTLTALDAGRREANPMIRSTLGNPAGLFLLKAGTAAGVVLITERLWRRNRTAAVVMMIALNSAYATMAANNYRLGQQSMAR